MLKTMLTRSGMILLSMGLSAWNRHLPLEDVSVLSPGPESLVGSTDALCSFACHAHACTRQAICNTQYPYQEKIILHVDSRS